MGPWDWIIVTLVVFGVLQVLALRYALRREPTEPDARQSGMFMPEFDGQDAPDRSATGAGALVCPHCGTENASGYTYCRNCVNLLGR